jgi:hypothetical protein
VAESFYSILTNIGKAKIANAHVLGTQVTFTTMAVGDGGGSYYNPVETKTALKHEVWRGNINEISTDPDNPNWIVINTVIVSNVGGFMVREVGVFDAEGDMIAIGKVPETFKPVLDSGSAKDLYVRLVIEVTNTSSVTLKVDPSITLATKKYVDEKIALVTIPDASLTQKGKVMLSNAVDSDSESQAATPKAVKAATLQAKAYTDDQISLVTATGIPKLVSYPLQVTATEANQTTFDIPLDTFDVATDTLIVIINRAFLDASHYTVKTGTRDEAGELVKRAEVELARGVTVGSKLSLIVLKNVPTGADGSINGAVLATDSVPINRVNGLQDKLDEAFQAGNERKSELVAALIAKGIQATTDDSWNDLLDKVDSIVKATGNAAVGDIRQGKTATTDEGNVVGTLPVRTGGAVTPSKTTQTKQAGIYDSDIVVEGSSNLVAGNIRSGVNMFGVVGSYSGNIRIHSGTLFIPAGSTASDFYPSPPKMLWLNGATSASYTGQYSFDNTAVYILYSELNVEPSSQYRQYSNYGSSSISPNIVLNSPLWQTNQLVYRNLNSSFALFVRGLVVY